jgi:hypothetical protein
VPHALAQATVPIAHLFDVAGALCRPRLEGCPEKTMDDPEQDANASLGEGRPRPVCPECGMRMISNIVETLRSLECLRCGHVEDDQA